MYGINTTVHHQPNIGANTLIGVCGYTSIDHIVRKAEFSLYIRHGFGGHNFGEKALKTLVSHGFYGLNLNCIWGEVFEGNHALKIFKRVGFKEEGTLRSRYYKNGEYVNSIMVSILREEWPSLPSGQPRL